MIAEAACHPLAFCRREVYWGDPRKIDLVWFADRHLRQRSGTDVAFFNAMLNVIISEDLYDREFVEAHTEGFEEMRRCVADYTPEKVQDLTGVPAGEIRAAARTFAKAKRAAR